MREHAGVGGPGILLGLAAQPARPRMSVLVVRPSSLGDVVYALAVVSDIARHRPGTAIDWVAERGFTPLVALDARVRTIVPLALRRWRRAPLSPASWRDARAFLRTLRAERYDVVLDLQEQLKGALVARIARGVRHGFDRDSVREPLATLFDDVHHRVARDLHFVHRVRLLAAAALGYELDTPPQWQLRAPPQPAAILDRRYAVALTATSRADKRWPPSHWRALLARLAQAGLAVVLPWGSEAERRDSQALAADAPSAIVPPWLSMADAAGVLARAELCVGVDTGFTHLAAALGTPTVAIFTATDVGRHGVACTGAHARDVGDAGIVPDVDEAMRAAADVWRPTPRC
jgi:heptosyltransferase-1